MVVEHNEYQGLCGNGWQVTPILTLAMMERLPVLKNFLGYTFSIEHKTTQHLELLAHLFKVYNHQHHYTKQRESLSTPTAVINGLPLCASDLRRSARRLCLIAGDAKM
uniref:Uncharacterized protein n=1 Tax=Romanomermis culicivorax TaxID=13658 RepID=A0A915K0Q2_ROMCU